MSLFFQLTSKEALLERQRKMIGATKKIFEEAWQPWPSELAGMARANVCGVFFEVKTWPSELAGMARANFCGVLLSLGAGTQLKKVAKRIPFCTNSKRKICIHLFVIPIFLISTHCIESKIPLPCKPI